MEKTAQWMGQQLTGLPGWLQLVSCAVLFIGAIVLYYVMDIDAFRPNRKDLGEKKK